MEPSASNAGPGVSNAQSQGPGSPRRPAAPARLPSRPVDAHKGDFGRVLVVGGSIGMVGAPSLAANAALRSGAGLVTVACPMVIQQSVATLCPCATTFPLPQSNTGTLAKSAGAAIQALAHRCNPLVIGPGLGQHLELADVLRTVLGQADRTVVLDADALNTLAQMPDWWPLLPPAVLTPHPGEMLRLMESCGMEGGLDASAERRVAAASALAERTGSVVVLKGHETVVADGRQVCVNRTGNSGMATGGSGDVLSGVIGACIGHGLDPYEAACLGVYVHGLAGDLVAERIGPVGLIATDLLEGLALAWKLVEPSR